MEYIEIPVKFKALVRPGVSREVVARYIISTLDEFAATHLLEGIYDENGNYVADMDYLETDTEFKVVDYEV